MNPVSNNEVLTLTSGNNGIKTRDSFDGKGKGCVEGRRSTKKMEEETVRKISPWNDQSPTTVPLPMMSVVTIPISPPRLLRLSPNG